MTRPTSSLPAGAFSRRRALTGLTTVGLALPVLAACSDDAGTASTSTATDPTSAPTSAETPTPSAVPEGPEGPEGSESTEPDAGAPEPAEGLAPTGDIPVGGGVVFGNERVVVTQPEAGDFKCFSAVCTHTGCLVGGVSSTIDCPCHGSSFDLSTGEVLGGPASAPLPAVAFTITDDQVVLS